MVELEGSTSAGQGAASAPELRKAIEGGSPQKTDPYVYQGMFELYDYFGLADLVKEIPPP
jgi:hypothetical protein